MPRYYFNRVDGGIELDTEGVELRDLQDARIEAVLFAGQTLKDRPELVWSGHELRIQVSGRERNLLFTIAITMITSA